MGIHERVCPTIRPVGGKYHAMVGKAVLFLFHCRSSSDDDRVQYSGGGFAVVERFKGRELMDGDKASEAELIAALGTLVLGRMLHRHRYR